MKKSKSILQLKKSVISGFTENTVIGGRVTTDQETMKYCDTSSSSSSEPATISYSNCGQCGDW